MKAQANPTKVVKFCKMLPAWISVGDRAAQCGAPAGCWLEKLENGKYIFLLWLFVEISAGLVPREAERRKGVGEKHLTSESGGTGCVQGMGQLKIPAPSCGWIRFLWWKEGRVPWGNICRAPGPSDIRSDILGHITGGCSMKFNISMDQVLLAHGAPAWMGLVSSAWGEQRAWSGNGWINPLPVLVGDGTWLGWEWDRGIIQWFALL